MKKTNIKKYNRIKRKIKMLQCNCNVFKGINKDIYIKGQ
jgi:hypothetical protein